MRSGIQAHTVEAEVHYNSMWVDQWTVDGKVVPSTALWEHSQLTPKGQLVAVNNLLLRICKMEVIRTWLHSLPLCIPVLSIRG
jgi:hypothetical protein